MSFVLFNVARRRFHLTDKSIVVFQGWYDRGHEQNTEITVTLDDETLNYTIEKYVGMEVRQRYAQYGDNINEEYYLYVQLPSNLQEHHKLVMTTRNTEEVNETHQVFEVPVSVLLREQKQVDYCIDVTELQAEGMVIRGWIASSGESKVVPYRDGKLVENAKIKRYKRPDVSKTYREIEKVGEYGFEVLYPGVDSGKVELLLEDGVNETRYELNLAAIKAAQRVKSGAIFVKAYRYLKKNGLRQTMIRTRDKLANRSTYITGDYDKLRESLQLTPEQIQAQKKKKFEYEPKFSIVVPLYKTPEKYLKELVKSVQGQTYKNWELCLSDGSGENSPLKGYLDHLKRTDKRIKVIASDQQLQISENTNAALTIATGDFIVFSDHDDVLAIDALYECAFACNKDRSIEMIYTDEDKISMNGKKYFQPHFKSDFNIDLLCSMNYFCHLVAVKRSVVEQVGNLNSEFDGAQDYDFVLRCVEATEHIYHIPKVLYHWRAHMNSTAENPESKAYAFTAGQRAIEAHYRRVGIPATVELGEYPGLYRTTYHWEEQPLVSIVIPNKDHIDDLDQCIQSIEKKSRYRNIEYVIVENNSTEEETFAYYEKLQKENEKARVIYWKEDFNYSKINNFGVKQAKGDYILLLNNDTEMINPDCIEQMLGYCMREDVGIVGARLYYEDDIIQHAGVVIGFGGIAGHAFIGSRRDENGYFSRIICAQDYSAVTAACLMTKKSVFEQVGGLTEDLKVALNDIDYCMKVRSLGKLVVYNPYAELYHYESKSRGMEDSPEKQARFYQEMEYFTTKWADILRDGDPYFNPNLDLGKADFSIRTV